MRGSSPFLGVSSTSAGNKASGSRPICCKSSRRRGEAEARTSLGRQALGSSLKAVCSFLRRFKSFESIRDTTFSQVVGRHFNEHLVAGQHTDAIFTHFP